MLYILRAIWRSVTLTLHTPGCYFADYDDAIEQGIVIMDDLVARYPDQWNYNRYARFACRAGDRDTAQAVLAKIAYPLPGAWYDEPDRYARCRSWAEGDQKDP